MNVSIKLWKSWDIWQDAGLKETDDKESFTFIILQIEVKIEQFRSKKNNYAAVKVGVGEPMNLRWIMMEIESWLLLKYN